VGCGRRIPYSGIFYCYEEGKEEASNSKLKIENSKLRGSFTSEHFKALRCIYCIAGLYLMNNEY
jgi:hypothetical protein